MTEKTNQVVPRYYQEESAQALFDSIKDNKKCHPIVALPTGSGKSYTFCEFINLFLSENPTEKILVLSHIQEILEQDFNSLEKYFEGIDVGLYSSGLESKTIKKITVAGIQSVYRKPEMFSEFGIIIIDECHLISDIENSMYRSFLKKIDANYIGLTATPYRTGGGYLHEGKNALFTALVYDATTTEAFNRLVDEGFLAQLFSKPTKLKLETDGAKIIGGDFSEKDLSIRNNIEEITKKAVKESIKYGKKYKKWLCFAIDIDHAENIKKEFLKNGISAAVVHSKIDIGRDKVINDYRNGRYRVLINVNVLTTGFDVPDIDLILLMRPTQSPVLHVQMIGRGLRVVYDPNYETETIAGRLEAIENGVKPHCLVLDFAGNVDRLGPINNVEIKKKKKGNGSGDPIVKKCPECSMLDHISVKICKNCGYEFEFQQKLQTKSGTSEIYTRSKLSVPPNAKTWMNVDSVKYTIETSYKTRRKYIRVKYRCGLSTVEENVMIEDRGFSKHMAKHWIDYRWDYSKGEPPSTISQFKKNYRHFKVAEKIHVNSNGLRNEIIDYRF